MSAARLYERSRALLRRRARCRSRAAQGSAAATRLPLRASGRPDRSNVTVLAASNCFLHSAQDRMPGSEKQVLHAAMVKASFRKPPRAFSAGLRLLGGIRFGCWHIPRPHDRDYLVDDRIVAVAAARDRLHRSSVEPAVLDEEVIDVDADHLPEYDVTVGCPSIEIAQRDDLQKLTFERTRRCGDSRRAHQARRRWHEPGFFHFVDAARERNSRRDHGVAQVENCQAANELLCLLDKGQRVLASFAGEQHDRWSIGDSIEK